MRIYKDKGIDSDLFRMAYDNSLDLICVGNENLKNKIEKRVEEKLQKVYITSNPNGKVNHLIPGTTNTVLNPEAVQKSEKDIIESSSIYIFDSKNYRDFNSKRVLVHTESHELFHMFSSLIPGLMKDNKNVLIENGLKYYNTLGYYASFDGFNQLYYGEMFCETLTDMLSAIAVNTYNPMFKNEVCANDVLRKNYSNWKSNVSGYTFFTSLTRLAIAAFSNDPNSDFDDMIKNKKNIFFGRMKGRNGQILMKNDMLYGYIADPLHTKREFEKVLGEGMYDKFNLVIDSAFNSALEKQVMDAKVIKNYLKILPTFLNKKIDMYEKKGIFNKEDSIKIINNFNRVWNEVKKEYGIYFSQEDIYDFYNYRISNHLNLSL